ncbi:hypothetical protein OURE66S_02769 [Oligella ureolytica]
MDIETTIRLFTVYAIPVIFAITLHEAAHGYVARCLAITQPMFWAELV